MMEEINDLISDITEAARSDPGHVVDFKLIFTVSVINILWAIVGGKRYRRDDPEFKKILDNIDQFVRAGNAVPAHGLLYTKGRDSSMIPMSAMYFFLCRYKKSIKK